MRANALYRLVHNRKNEELHPGEKALLQVEIRFTNGRRMFVSTGIYLPAENFDKRNELITGTGVDVKLNKQAQDLIQRLRTAENICHDKHTRWDRAAVKTALLDEKQDGSFIGFCREQLGSKISQIAPGTRMLHELVIRQISEVGIRKFSDLTLTNVQKFDNRLREVGICQTTLHKRHQVVISYIHLAISHKHIGYDDNPYLQFKVPRGKHKVRTRLDDSEIAKLKAGKIDDMVLVLSRDLFLFQCFTTLSYKDLRNLTPAQIRKDKGGTWIEGLRKKTGEYFAVPLIPQALKILNKYTGRYNTSKCFPAPDTYQQNRLLKVVAAKCDLNKNLTTHVGRHTGATWMLRHGMTRDEIQGMLGHATGRTTEIYARLERESLRGAVKRLRK